MSRSQGYISVQGNLVADTPLRVGASRSIGDIDLPVLRNGRRQPLVPGSSLAGALRAWAAEHLDSSVVAQLFGGHENDLGASRLVVMDMAVPVTTNQRTGVGIDRATGTAAPGVLISYETIPRGITLPLWLELELPADGTDLRPALGALLEALVAGGIALGAGSRRGLGSVHLEASSLVIIQHVFTDRDSTLAALGDGTPVTLAELQPTQVTATTITIEAAWKATGMTMSKAPYDGLAIDMLPLVEVEPDGTYRAVLPGSSIKGVLRSFAERLWRTINDVEVSPARSADDMLDQVVAGPLIDAVFGAVVRDSTNLQPGDRRSRRGAMSLDDCVGQSTISPSVWSSVLSAAEVTDLASALDGQVLDSGKKASTMLSPSMHVAIDRWTGGAADSLLFSVLQLREAQWAPLSIRLDLAQLSRGLEGEAAVRRQRAGLALILVLLRSIDEGLIRLGFASNRGGGRMELTNVTIDPSTTADDACRALAGTYAQLDTGLTAEAMAPLMDALRRELTEPSQERETQP